MKTLFKPAIAAVVVAAIAVTPALAKTEKQKQDPSSYGNTAPNRSIDPKNDNYNANRGNGGNDNINRSDTDNNPAGENNSANPAVKSNPSH